MDITRIFKRQTKQAFYETFFIQLNGGHLFWIWRRDGKVTACRERLPIGHPLHGKERVCDGPPMLVAAIKNEFG